MKSPLPHILNIIITASATNASNQLVEAFVIAEPATLTTPKVLDVSLAKSSALRLSAVSPDWDLKIT